MCVTKVIKFQCFTKFMAENIKGEMAVYWDTVIWNLSYILWRSSCLYYVYFPHTYIYIFIHNIFLLHLFPSPTSFLYSSTCSSTGNKISLNIQSSARLPDFWKKQVTKKRKPLFFFLILDITYTTMNII